MKTFGLIWTIINWQPEFGLHLHKFSPVLWEHFSESLLKKSRRSLNSFPENWNAYRERMSTILSKIRLELPIFPWLWTNPGLYLSFLDSLGQLGYPVWLVSWNQLASPLLQWVLINMRYQSHWSWNHFSSPH